MTYLLHDAATSEVMLCSLARDSFPGSMRADVRVPSKGHRVTFRIVHWYDVPLEDILWADVTLFTDHHVRFEYKI